MTLQIGKKIKLELNLICFNLFMYIYLYIFFFLRKINNFNYKVVNWGDENMMSTIIKKEEADFNNTEILDDNTIEQIGQEVNELIELLDEDDEDDDLHSTATRYPGLTLNSIKRDHEDNGILFIIHS